MNNNSTPPDDAANARDDRGLGAPGPYMVCAVCNTPLDRYSVAKADDLSQEAPGSVRYTHGAALDDEDHPPVPKVGTPLEADQVCDFCHAPGPRYVFVPRRPIRFTHADGLLHDYSSPWSSCEDCLRPARRRDMTALLDRALNSPHGTLRQASRPVRRAMRARIRRLYSAFFRSGPAGPYETKIPDSPPPYGKRGGRRGI